MPVAILPFSPEHYPVFTQLWNEAYPELKRTELDLRLADLASGEVRARWIAEHDGRAVAFAGVEEVEPGKLQLHLVVDSDFRKHGIGTLLLKKVVDELGVSSALEIRVWVNEERTASLQFVERHGFKEQMRTHHSALAVKTFDLSRLAKYADRLKRNGYRLARFDELRDDPERNRKTHSLYCEVTREIPAAESPQLPTLDEYEERIRTTPEFFGAHFIASYGSELVGLCILLPKDRRKRELYADTLGVRRAFRGRGIAQALSLAGIEYAKSRGYELITADNFSENTLIIPLLDSLGFGERSTWTLFSKRLSEIA